MAQRRKAMIKADKVRLEGSVDLPAGAADAPQAPSAGAAEPAARILRQDDGVTVVEIVCACGKKLCLNCTHKT